MSSMRSAAYGWRALAILSFSLLCASIQAPQPAHATTIQHELDNTINDFLSGEFQSTALDFLRSTQPNEQINDLEGAVALATSGQAYVSAGWFYSRPQALVFNSVQVQELSWTTVITRSDAAIDIQVSFRSSTAEDCSSTDAFAGTDWQLLDASPSAFFSEPGANTVVIAARAVHCIQYRAQLLSSNPALTPFLLNTSIRIDIPGSPDLIGSIAPSYIGDGAQTLSGLNVQLRNHNDAEQTLPADIQAPGSFFVDLFVFGPGETPIPPNNPLSPDDIGRSKAYADIPKGQMGIDATLRVTAWKDSKTNAAVNPLSFFKVPGLYTTFIVLDSFGFVPEGSTGGEANNVLQASFSIQGVSAQTVFLPFAARGTPCDIYEPNDDRHGAIAGPLVLGQTYQAKICDGDEDNYYFEIPAAQTIHLSLALPDGFANNTLVWIYAQTKLNTPLPFCSAAPVPTKTYTVTCSILQSGRYIVRIYTEPGVFNAQQPYTMRLDG